MELTRSTATHSTLQGHERGENIKSFFCSLPPSRPAHPAPPRRRATKAKSIDGRATDAAVIGSIRPGVDVERPTEEKGRRKETRGGDRERG
eukprot:scaffold175355_cov27-Tisochrysis_lutea.AAC.1